MDLTPTNIVGFRSRLVEWAAHHGRDFSWRSNRTPYRVLLAEMMLRRTRAAQVEPVYRTTVGRFRSIRALAKAEPSELASRLQPLGLVWRARDIATMAREVESTYHGRVPSDPVSLKGLTGVGDYVANAVACFAGGVALPIVDTNVVRVLGRVFGLSLQGEARRRREMLDAAAACVDPVEPATYNYAILDFAAGVCRARDPACGSCPFGGLGECTYALRAL